MDNNSSLDGIARQESRWKRLGQRALSELKILPYEIAGLIAGGTPGYFAGSSAGKAISQRTEAPIIYLTPPTPDDFLQDPLKVPLNYQVGKVLGRHFQDAWYSGVGGVIGTLILGTAAAVGARYLVNKYSKNKAN